MDSIVNVKSTMMGMSRLWFEDDDIVLWRCWIVVGDLEDIEMKDDLRWKILLLDLIPLEKTTKCCWGHHSLQDIGRCMGLSRHNFLCKFFY